MNQPGTCTGNSGHPRVVIFAAQCEVDQKVILNACVKVNGYNRFSQIREPMIDWIETQSGIDITPCFDKQGQPNPSEACDAFMAYAGDPSAPKGTQAKACEEAPKVWAGAFGEVPKHGPDPEEPEDPAEPEDSEEKTSSTGEDETDGESEEDTESGDASDSDDESGPDSGNKSQKKNLRIPRIAPMILTRPNRRSQARTLL